MARNLLDDYMNQPKRQGNKNLLDEYIKMSTPKLDTTAYTNMLNTLLNSSAVTGNGYQTPAVMASAANTARKAQQIAEKYGIGDSSYRQYLDSVASGVQGKQQFMSQFTGQQDYNERYAYPQTVKGKTDAEIEAMMGAVPKAQNLLNRAAAFGKGTGSSGDDAYQKWLTDYFNNQTVTGLDRQIADNQGLLDANKAKQDGLLASAYVPENVGMTAADRKIREDYIAQYPSQERQEMEWTEMATGLAGWEEQKQIIEEMIKELQESGSFDQAKMDELQDSWLDAERHIHNLEEQMDAYTAPDEAERLAGQETHTYVGATPEQERLDDLYYQYLDELDKDNKLKYETGPEQWAYDRDTQLYGLTSEQEKLDAQIAVLNAKREGVVARSKYNELASAPDFGAKSAFDSSIEDELYRYINTKGTSRATETGYSAKTSDGVADWGAEGREMDYIQAGYSFLTSEEVLAYSYIYKTQGKAAAQLFLDSFKTVRAQRMRTQEIEDAAKFAEDYGAWASVVSLGTNFKSGLMYPFQALDAAINPNHNQFSPLFSANYATEAIRGVRGQAWSELFNGTEFMGADMGSTAYQVLMSLGDMGVSMLAGKVGGMATGSKFAQGVTQLVMSSEAGSAALKANLERGLPADKALGMSVASALIEALTEKYSIEALLANPKNAAQYLAKNIITEGSEEAASNLANTLVDLLVNADQAELMQAANEKGWAAALTEYAQSVGLDAIMGALSGGIMGGGSVAVNKGVQAYHTSQTGKQINTNQTYKQLHDIAVAMPEGSKARKIAQGNDKLNNRKAGQLYNALMEELDAKYQTSVRKSMVTDIKGRLQELGAQGDTTQVAEAIQKAWMGEKLSARESDLIAQSKLAMQVQHELLDLEEGWAEKAHETASKQRRETLAQMLDVERLASKGYKPAQDDAAAKAISKNASTTYANADQEKGLNTTAYTKEGTTVEIKRIDEQDGKAVYLVEKDGQDVTYAINDLELDSINTENLVQPLKRGKMSVQAANTMMQLYATSGLSAPLYAKGFMVAYNAGVQRIGMAYVNNNSYSKALSPEVRKAAFDAGMVDTKDEAPSVTKRKGRVTVDKSIDKANLTDNQKASIRAMEKLAKALHIDIEFFASKADATGSYAAYENGSFRDGVMRLDINAGRDKSTDVTEFAILRTASHELTHYIAEASLQMYQELQAFVVDHLLEKGQSLQTLMDRKKARENRAMSDEAALAEVIADACEMMLKDSTAIETLARENATLFEKMADWLRDFFDKIREAFAGVEAVHAEARALMEADADGVMHYIDGLQALWDKALVDAAHNVQGAEASAADGEYRREKFSRRGGLLNAQEAKRLESNWNDYKYRGYQFEKRANGGIIVVMDNIMVYTDAMGNAERVLEIPYIENPDIVWAINDIQQRMMGYEKEGISYERQRKLLKSMAGTRGAYFRSSGKGRNAGNYDRRGAGQDTGRMGRRVQGQVSEEEEVSYSVRDADTISSREALANALETAAKNELERGLLADYKKIIQSLNEDQEKLAGHQKIIRELSFKKGGLSQQEKDELAMAKNRAEIVRNRLNRNDKKLLKLEATEALKAVVARERVVAERKIREEKDKQLAEYRERTRDTLTRSALRDRIRHDVKALNRLLLNETDVKHVPEELKGAVAQFLTVFTQDTSVFDQKKLDDLRYAYGKISDRNAANEDLPDISAQYDWDIANMMDELREILPGKRLSELTQEETRKIRDIVQHFKFIVKESSRLFFYDKSQNVAKAGQKFIEDTDQQKKYNGPDGAVANMLRGGMITPSYFFKKLGGVAKELFDDLKQGESTYGLRVAQARKFFDDVAKKYHYDDWRNVKDDVLTLNTQQGHEVVLTREQALGLYATWNRENSENGQNASHLSEGGFVYEEAMKKDKKTGKIEVDTSKPHKMTDKDMQQVANWLTDEQRAYADAMVEYMSKDMAKLGNEVSMKLFGIEKYGEEKYYPYQTSKNYRYTALGAAAATNDQRLKHSSFTHRVTQFANNPIIAADFTTVWANHVNHMLLYSSMCVPLENFNRVYNYKYTDEDGNHSVKQSLINAYGSSAQKYIEQLMHDLNGGVAVQSDGVMDQLTSKFKKNAVYASASVVVQQPSAMVRAMALVNPKYFASGVMKDGSWDELTQYSGVAVIKEMGGFDTSTGFGAQDWITGERRKTKLETFSKKADDIASLLPERADRLAWVAIWKAVKAEVADNTGLEGEELMQAAAKRFDEVIGYTQVYDSTLSKSQMMRNKHLNAVTAFMAEPTVTYNLLVDAFFNRGKADSVNPARAVAAFTATAIVNAMLKSLVTAARDDEEKNYLEKYAGEFVENVTSDLNPLNLIPYARDIVSIMQGYDVERADMSLISDLYKGVKRGVESAKDGDWYTMAKEFAGPISGLVGLPVKNVWRDIEAVFNTIHSIGTPMTPGGMKYSILEALPFYGSTPTDYYSRRLDAMLEGDASELESLTMHLETGLGKAAKTVKSKTKEELGKRYKAGKIGDAEATDILMDYFEMDADEAYWQLKEWREKEAHKDEDEYSFSRTDDLKEALLSGKTAQIEAAKTELAGVGGYTDKEVVSKAKSAIKSLYVDGQITLDKAMKLLQDQAGDMTQDDLYWTEQEWAYEKANPDGEWNKFMGAHAAIESGKGAKQAAKELLTHGVEKGDAARVIATKWKATYVNLYNTDRKAALDLHSRILDMYVALGYSRSYQIKYIKDNWFD